MRLSGILDLINCQFYQIFYRITAKKAKFFCYTNNVRLKAFANKIHEGKTLSNYFFFLKRDCAHRIKLMGSFCKLFLLIYAKALSSPYMPFSLFVNIAFFLNFFSFHFFILKSRKFPRFCLFFKVGLLFMYTRHHRRRRSRK